MKRSDEVYIAHNALQQVDLQKVTALIEAVNLTPQEKDIIIKSELQKIRIKEIQDIYSLSIDSIMRIKTKGLKKIAAFIFQKNNK